MILIKDITITSLETITAFDVVTGNYKFTLDELQNATIANTQDSTEITGKGGRKLANLKRNKAVSMVVFTLQRLRHHERMMQSR